MFWILKSVNFALNPSFWMIRAYLRDASRESSSDFAPVTTIFPEAKMRAVVLGSRIRMMTAAKRYTLRFSNNLVRLVASSKQYLGVVLRIASVERDRLEIQTAIEIDRGDDVS